MHLPEKIPLGGCLYIHEGLGLGLWSGLMDVSKAGYGRIGWISVSFTCLLLVYNFTALNLPQQGMIEKRDHLYIRHLLYTSSKYKVTIRLSGSLRRTFDTQQWRARSAHTDTSVIVLSIVGISFQIPQNVFLNFSLSPSFPHPNTSS